METTRITRADQVPAPLQRAAKAALCVGACIAVNSDRDGLLVQFDHNDTYRFDPDDATLHCFELLGHARDHGFVMSRYDPNDNMRLKWGRMPLVVRTVYNNQDVRVQIGASRWYLRTDRNTAVAMRHSVIDAFCAYYDEAIAPYPEA